ncbi:filamentous hemagglutinin family protein [Sandaracinobacter neustonicus]|nr:filamentous hemagglutinin family protein [Sandaracinobacter neustonicus]
MRVSQIRANNGGDINLLVPGGSIQLASLAVANTSPASAGVVTQRGGSVSAVTRGDCIVNQSRTMTADDGDILIWSSFGNIDAGRGRKSSLSVPPVVFPVDAWGRRGCSFRACPTVPASRRWIRWMDGRAATSTCTPSTASSTPATQASVCRPGLSPTEIDNQQSEIEMAGAEPDDSWTAGKNKYW